VTTFIDCSCFVQARTGLLCVRQSLTRCICVLTENVFRWHRITHSRLWQFLCGSDVNVFFLSAGLWQRPIIQFVTLLRCLKYVWRRCCNSIWFGFAEISAAGWTLILGFFVAWRVQRAELTCPVLITL
jgi:predicted cupin superfamily sugar epimerase